MVHKKSQGSSIFQWMQTILLPKAYTNDQIGQYSSLVYFGIIELTNDNKWQHVSPTKFFGVAAAKAAGLSIIGNLLL